MIKFRKELQQISPYIPGKPIEELKRELNIKQEIIKLASNENPLGMSVKALSAIKEDIENINNYPDDSNYYLKKKISKIKDCQIENILIGNGSVELLNMIVSSVCEKGDILIRSKHAFIMSKISPLMAGAKVIDIDMKNHYHNIDALIKAVKQYKAKVLYIDNPTNPLGTMLNQKQIKDIVNTINKDVLIILDEAYNEYIDEHNKVNSIDIMKEHNNIVILNTFSKIYGLAGLRIGYMLANSELIKNISKMRLPFNVNKLAQKAALYALDDFEFVDKSKENNNKGKQYLITQLKSLNFKPIDSYTNFITFDTGFDSKIVFDKLLKKGIIIRPLKAYELNNYIRVTIGTMEQNKRFIESFKEVLNEF